MLLISKFIVAVVAMVPLFIYAQVISPDPVMPKATPIRYSQEYNEQVIRETFGKYAPQMLAIAKCESGYNNLAVNETDRLLNSHPSKGLFQISEIHGENKDWWKPEISASAALTLFKKEGVRPWYNCSLKLGLL